MKTTQEILAVLDVMDAKASIYRKINDYERKPVARWNCAIAAERNGVKVEVASQVGETFDDALAKAWAKFEPAVAGGLPQLAIEDAEFTPAAPDYDAPF